MDKEVQKKLSNGAVAMFNIATAYIVHAIDGNKKRTASYLPDCIEIDLSPDAETSGITGVRDDDRIITVLRFGHLVNMFRDARKDGRTFSLETFMLWLNPFIVSAATCRMVRNQMARDGHFDKTKLPDPEHSERIVNGAIRAVLENTVSVLDHPSPLLGGMCNAADSMLSWVGAILEEGCMRIWLDRKTVSDDCWSIETLCSNIADLTNNYGEKESRPLFNKDRASKIHWSTNTRYENHLPTKGLECYDTK